MKLKLTIEHPSSEYGRPIFLDENDNPLDYIEGIKRLRQIKKITITQLGIYCGVSGRTAEGWEQGRMPSVSALKLMQLLL